MISEIGEPITIINGITIKKCNLPKKVTYNDRYNQPDLYGDPLKEIKEERSRILNYRSKPCPPDFPQQLKPYWKGHLEFSLTPCQSGWMYLDEKKRRNKVKTRK